MCLLSFNNFTDKSSYLELGWLCWPHSIKHECRLAAASFKEDSSSPGPCRPGSLICESVGCRFATWPSPLWFRPLSHILASCTVCPLQLSFMPNPPLMFFASFFQKPPWGSLGKPNNQVCLHHPDVIEHLPWAGIRYREARQPLPSLDS